MAKSGWIGADSRRESVPSDPPTSSDPWASTKALAGHTWLLKGPALHGSDSLRWLLAADSSPLANKKLGQADALGAGQLLCLSAAGIAVG